MFDNYTHCACKFIVCLTFLCGTVEEMLMARVGLGKDAHVIDLTSRRGTAQTLTETRILCSQEDKVSDS